MRILKRAVVVCCTLILACDWFPYATFALAPESRLPGWFTLPEAASRKDVEVAMNYFSDSTGSYVTFELRDTRTNRSLAKVRGNQRLYDEFRIVHAQPGDAPFYPRYLITEVNGVIEIVEHRRMEPIFYITDDPEIREKVLGTPGTPN